jgi:hypothetical protein
MGLLLLIIGEPVAGAQARAIDVLTLSKDMEIYL